MIVVPVNVLVPPNSSVPLPVCCTLPLPEIAAVKLAALSERSKTSRPLSTMFPLSQPVEPPLPNWSVPGPIVVPPL